MKIGYVLGIGHNYSQIIDLTKKENLIFFLLFLAIAFYVIFKIWWDLKKEKFNEKHNTNKGKNRKYLLLKTHNKERKREN
jgi:hypothetical protein